MKKKTSSLVLILLILVSIFSIGFATWIISFDQNFDANYNPQTDVNINNLYDQKLTYNGQNQTVNTKILGDIINDYSLVITKDDIEVSEVKDAGLYIFSYTSTKENLQPFNINLTIEPIRVDVTFTVSYLDNSKDYVNIYDIRHYDKYVEGNKVNLSAKITGILANDECNVDIINYAPFDFGVNKSFGLSLSGQHANNYTLNQDRVNIVVKQKVIFKGNLVELDYDPTFESNTFVSKLNNYFLNNKETYFFNEDGTPFESNFIMNPVTYLHNGTYVYPTNYKGDLGFTPEVCESKKVVGSTYEVYLKFNDSKFEFVQDKTNLLNQFKIILKYKTAKIGNNYFTIEDALNASGTISFAGDSSSADSFVPTAFTALDYYGKNSYELTGGRKLIVPYNDTLDERNSNSSASNGPTNYNTFSNLYIPRNITLNVTNKATLVTAGEISAVMGFNGFTGIHGSIMNNGVINVSGANLKSFGYIKGLNVKEGTHEYGVINANNSSYVEDVFAIYNFPGGKHSLALNNKVFQISNYSFHNISTLLRIDKSSSLHAFWRISVTILTTTTHEGTVELLGSKGLFTLKNNDGYIEKYATNVEIDSANNTFYTFEGDSTKKGINSSVTVKNHADYSGEVTQKDIFNLYGDFNDNNVKINLSAGISVQTSTKVALPIGFMDINLHRGKGILSANSYKFMPGSTLKINKGATLETGSNVHIVAYDENFLTKEYDIGGTKYKVDNWTQGYKKNHAKFLALKTDKIAAQIINDGIFLSNGHYGGELKTSLEGATTILKNNTSSVQEVIDENNNHQTFTENARGLISDGASYSEQNFQANSQYNSVKDSDGTYHWSTPTTPKKFTVNYYDKDTTTPTTVDVYMNSDTSSLTGDEYIPTKLYHDFDNWYEDSSLSIPFTGRNDIKPGQTIDLYAKYSLHEYKIIYNFGYNDELIEDTSLVNGDKNQISFTFDGTTFTYWTDVNNKKTGSSIPLPSGYTYTLEDGSIKIEEEGWHIGIVGIQLTEEKINDLTNDQFALWVQETGNTDLFLSKLFVDHTITIVGKNGVSTTFGVMNGTNLNTLGSNNIIRIFANKLNESATDYQYTGFIYNGVTYKLNEPETWDILVESDIELTLKENYYRNITFKVTTPATSRKDELSAMIFINDVQIEGSYNTHLLANNETKIVRYLEETSLNIRIEGYKWNLEWFEWHSYSHNINYYQTGAQKVDVNATTTSFDYIVPSVDDTIIIDIAKK